MKELVKQRAIQFQKEEEERIREQKVKALAKLEELNRRTQGNSASKTERVLGATDEEQPTCDCIGGAKSEAIKPALAPIFDDVSQLCVGTVQLGDKSANLVACFPSDGPKAVAMEPPVVDGQSLTVKEEVKNADASDCKVIDRMPMSNSSYPKKGGQSSRVSTRREWGADHDSEEEMFPSSKTEGDSSSLNCSNDQVDQDSDTAKVKSFQNLRSSVVDSGQVNQDAIAASSPGMQQASVVMQRGLPITATSRDSTLMQKIEGLNVKIRGSVGRYDGLQMLESDERKLRAQTSDTNVSDVSTKVGNVSVSDEKVNALNNMGALSSERIPTFGDKTSQPSFISRRPGDHVHGKSGDVKRSRNQINHSGCSRESQGDWNQERQRHNSHYEYHPVGSHNNRKPGKIEDGSHNVGPRYKDRDQSQSKQAGQRKFSWVAKKQ